MRVLQMGVMLALSSGCYVMRASTHYHTGSMQDTLHNVMPEEVKHAVSVGEIAPEISLTAQDGTRFDLAQTLAKGPVVLVFYRGDW